MSDQDGNTSTPTPDPAPGSETPPAPAPPPASAAPAQPDPLADLTADRDRWKANSRRNEEKKNEALNKVNSLTTELNSVTEQKLALELESTHSIAVKDLHIALARAGVKKDDAEALASITDPSRLVEDGKPSEAAIEQVVKAFVRSRPPVPPDPDQGAGNTRGAKPPTSFDQALRALTGYAGSEG